MQITSYVLLAMLLLVVAVGAAEAALPSYACPKVSTPPTIDGKLDDAAWKNAPVVELINSVTGKPVTKSTKARMCWDDTCLYVAFDSVDTDIWGTFTKRDDHIWMEEVVEIFLNPSCDLVHYYEINVSPRNVIFDAYIVNPLGDQPTEGTTFDWNCKDIRTAVQVDGTLDNRDDTDRGWTAEMAIPFAGLDRSTPRAGERWRGNLYRIDLLPLPEEYQAWSPTLYDPARFHVPGKFGTIFFTECP